MSGNLIRYRKYPWRFTADGAEALLTAAEDGVRVIRYTGGALIEISDKKLIRQAKHGKQNFLYAVTEDVRQDGRESYGLFSYPCLLIRSSGRRYAEYDGTEGPLRFALSNTVKANEENKKPVEEYLSFFDELKNANQTLYSYELYDKVREISGGRDTPRYALIASMAEQLLKVLPKLNRSLRRVLTARRELLPLSRVREMDAKCIRTLIRQPGNTVEEKISNNNFKLLALKRTENFDLLENRVLKDFLCRCLKAGRDYVAEYESKPELLKHIRVTRVRTLIAYVKQILASEQMQAVLRQDVLPTPNYVLQNDPDYKIIWENYLKLLRQQKEADAAFAYQDRTFKDLVDLFMQAGLSRLTQEKTAGFTLTEMATAKIRIYPEQHSGQRLMSEPIGPFMLVRGKLSCVVMYDSRPFDEGRNGNTKYLGCQSILKFYAVTETGVSARDCALVPIYILNTAQAGTGETQEEIHADACRCLNEALKNAGDKYRFGAVVFTNHDGPGQRALIKDHFALFSFSASPQNWGADLENLAEFLKNYIAALL